MDGAEHPLVKIQRMAAADKKAPLESEVGWYAKPAGAGTASEA